MEEDRTEQEATAFGHRERVGRQRPDTEDSPTIHELLVELGETADQVAETLLAEGCRGPQQNDCFCPVALYLSKRSGRAASATDTVCVLGEFDYDSGGHINTFIGREWTQTPPAVGEAIRRYDNGDYSYLSDNA